MFPCLHPDTQGPEITIDRSGSNADGSPAEVDQTEGDKPVPLSIDEAAHFRPVQISSGATIKASPNLPST